MIGGVLLLIHGIALVSFRHDSVGIKKTIFISTVLIIVSVLLAFFAYTITLESVIFNLDTQLNAYSFCG